ncbi:MAG: riboflavin synthase [Acidimicrobiales bacterium]
MFTGIVEELGRLQSREGGRLVIQASFASELVVGESVAVNGCCLTVVAIHQGAEGTWAADAVDETLRRTALGTLVPGDQVNLERSVRMADRLGGHLVQGHVDGVGTVVDPAPDLVVALPAGLGRYVVEKGSITLDGVSLTVAGLTTNECGQGSRVSVAVIPHTSAVTTLGRRNPGDEVNVEVDLLAKYVERLLAGPNAGRMLAGQASKVGG